MRLRHPLSHTSASHRSIKGKKLSSDDCKKSDSCLGDCRAKASKEPIQVGPIVPIQVGAAMKVKSPIKPRVAAKPARMVLKEAPGDESGYAKLRAEYNRILGHYQTRRRSAAPKPDLPEIKPGSPEFYMVQHFSLSYTL